MRWSKTVMLMFCLWQSQSGHSATEYSNESYYPAVFAIEESGGGLLFRLGGYYSQPKGENEHNKKAPLLAWSEPNGWKRLGEWDCGYCAYGYARAAQRCPVTIPQWEPDPRLNYFSCQEWPGKFCVQGKDIFASEADRRFTQDSIYGIDEHAYHCAKSGETIWFGISFYSAEGLTGSGGVGRYDTEHNRVTVRRPEALRNYSIRDIVWDGQRLWLATEQNLEGFGGPPALGLVRYEWERDAFTRVTGVEEGPCGFVVHDLHLKDQWLWVATDVGVSKRHIVTGEWRHYLPDVIDPANVHEGGCKGFYRSALKTLPADRGCDECDHNYYNELLYRIKKFKPGIYAQMVRDGLQIQY